MLQQRVGARYLPQVVVATAAVAVLPVVVVWWLRARGVVTSPWVCLALAVALSFAISLIGSAYWKRRRGSGDKHTNYAGALGLPNPFQSFNWPNFTNMDLGSYPFGTANPFWLVSNFGLFEDK